MAMTRRSLISALAALPALVLAPAAHAAKTKETPAQRLAVAKKLLAQASAASKVAAVKQGIAQAQAMLGKNQLEPARQKVDDLKRAAALGRDDASVVLKLIDAEDAIRDALRKPTPPRKK